MLQSHCPSTVDVSSVFLIDTAQFLVHSCTYELPALKQEISRSEKELAELQRRQSEYTRLADASHARFVAACAKRRIPSTEEDAEGLRAQLEASRAQLKPLFERVARRLQTAPIPAALDEYRSFLTYALDKVEAAPPPTSSKPGAAAKGKGGSPPLNGQHAHLNGGSKGTTTSSHADASIEV